MSLETLPLKPCAYRESRFGKLICKMAENGILTSSNVVTSDVTTEEVCQACEMPHITQQVNCRNLDVGRQHREVTAYSFESFEQAVVLLAVQINCKAIGFSDLEDYQDKCSPRCPSFRAVHRDLSGEERIPVDNFDAATATDRQLRQAILAILYQYHARHPERYEYFDVTPDFIARSLGITAQDVVRVIAPMQEEGEIATSRFPTDAHFRYVAIRSKGIQMIDEEPLFQRLDTAGVRVMGNYTAQNFYDSVSGVAGNVEGNQNIQ
jgi:hypothetical protein